MKYIVDIKGEIEGDYEIIGKYEERPQGEWITSDKLKEGFYICSNCKEISCCKGNYCCDCGADMRGDK